MNSKSNSLEGIEIILGNSNRRFSGVTSTMLQVLPHISQNAHLAVLGRHHLPEGVQTLSFFRAIKILRKRLKDGRYRLFHARRNDEMIQALVLKYLFGCKLKIVFTSTAQRKKSWLTRFLMRNMDGLISTCQAAANYMPDAPDVIIPHGIDLNFFRADVNRSSDIVLPAKYHIGLFGRVRQQKGVDLLVDAALELLPEFKDWGVVFVGEITTEERAFVNQQIKKLTESGLADRCLFTEHLPFEKLPTYFQSVDIVCALSVNEGFGLTVLEGASFSKPIVATKAGAWPDILSQTKMGELINVGDKDALVESLRKLMSNSDSRQNYGINGRTLVEKSYTVQREAEQLLTYYRSIIGHSKNN